MTTATFITLLMEEMGAGWTRQKALEVVDACQAARLGTDCDLMRVKPDPFVATTDGTYSYAASSKLYVSTTGAQGALVGDIRAVREVYRLKSVASLDELSPLDPNADKPQIMTFDSGIPKIFARVDFIDSIARGASDCTMKWWEQYNPGTTTITWRAKAYKWPTQLTAEGIALAMPVDFQHTLLFWDCLRHMERREYGRVDPVLYDKEEKRFRSKYMAKSGQEILGQAHVRPC
jgi:hypothetical protein